ncbi:hypothetical protein [Agromyces cerinus]|uniref:Uncharacterized protein n=1 Tax=Agromyces cerinus subsp. cerinus TaxID=232089 RepID=A0A1N6DP79_9MICO|nr:hypothetical protein [Agromyces cerinus]SIN72609.1 hypothetical protein SAMN05443544_0552 [Agromyces cerinus subsp. cerinus]
MGEQMPDLGFTVDSVLQRAREMLAAEQARDWDHLARLQDEPVSAEEQALADELSTRAEWTWVTGICNKGDGHFDDEGACSSHYSADVYIIPRANAPFNRHPDYEAIARQIGETGRE